MHRDILFGMVRGSEHRWLSHWLLLLPIHPRIAERRNCEAKFQSVEQHKYGACERTASEQREGAVVSSLP